MDGEFEAFCAGVILTAIVALGMFLVIIRPAYVEHAINCDTASYDTKSGILMWHDCAAAPEPAPVPEEAE